MSDPVQTQKIVEFWIGKSEESLAPAQAEFAAGRFSFAANRAYYVAFYAASALLLWHGKRFVKHAGLRSAVHRDLVKRGLLTVEWGKALDRLFESRQRADYLELAEVDAEEAAAMVAQAEGFAGEMKRLLAEQATRGPKPG